MRGEKIYSLNFLSMKEAKMHIKINKIILTREGKRKRSALFEDLGLYEQLFIIYNTNNFRPMSLIWPSDSFRIEISQIKLNNLYNAVMNGKELIEFNNLYDQIEECMKFQDFSVKF